MCINCLFIITVRDSRETQRTPIFLIISSDFHYHKFSFSFKKIENREKYLSVIDRCFGVDCKLGQLRSLS